MATKIPLGEKYYLFKHSDGPVDPSTDHLLISAHGGYMNLFGPLGSKHITVPSWTQLHFYGGHGATLQDPSVYGIMKGDFQVLETQGPGTTVTNYELSKYQGKHNTGGTETYGSISDNIDRNTNQLNYIGEEMAAGRAGASNATMHSTSMCSRFAIAASVARRH